MSNIYYTLTGSSIQDIGIVARKVRTATQRVTSHEKYEMIIRKLIS